MPCGWKLCMAPCRVAVAQAGRHDTAELTLAGATKLVSLQVPLCLGGCVVFTSAAMLDMQQAVGCMYIGV